MYIPTHFAVSDQDLLHAVMRRFSFATLVTTHEGRPFATHLPFMLAPASTTHPQGVLLAHLARANSQWHDFRDGAEALVIFQGQHSYISPSWYEVQPNVPTWNYTVVHAYGVPCVIDDARRVRDLLGTLVERHEAGFAEPWTLETLEDGYIEKMMRGIVAFELPIARLEGKFKLSQNRTEGDRRRAAETLATSSDPAERELAALMQATLP